MKNFIVKVFFFYILYMEFYIIMIKSKNKYYSCIFNYYIYQLNKYFVLIFIFLL